MKGLEIEQGLHPHRHPKECVEKKLIEELKELKKDMGVTL